MELSNRRPNLELVDHLDQPDDLPSDFQPLPEAVLQPILEREERLEERARRDAEHTSRLQRTRAFSRFVTRLSKGPGSIK